MRRYELVARRDIRLRMEVPVPVPVRDEVCVQVGACSICNRSDLAYFHYLGLRQHCASGCFGHEIAGTVSAVGPEVDDFAPGDRVFIRSPLTSGFADFALTRRISLGRLPKWIPFEQGSILQLLPLAVHATRGVGIGDRVLIIGQGPVGLMALQVAAIRGATGIETVDLDPWRLQRSAQLGATAVASMRGTSDCLTFARDRTGDFDVAIDAVGTPETVRACVDAVRVNGLVVLLGTHHVDTEVTFDLVQWERKGLRIHTSAEATDSERVAAMCVAERLAANGRIQLEPILTHTVPLTDLPAAIKRLSASRVLSPAGDPAPPFDGPPHETLKIAVVP